jgi:geranylgeranyl reductase family protein
VVDWDVVVVGGGPAGLAAARAAAADGARTLVLEKAAHPRYKTCGGGLIGSSLSTIDGAVTVSARDRVERATFTRDGRREFTRAARHGPLVAMVRREEFDNDLRLAAEAAGAEIWQRAGVREISQATDAATVRLGDGRSVTARTVVGADGSAGVTARHVGATYRQVDLGLEVELPVSGARQDDWRGRLLIDWGPLPGSYAWVFPKGDRLTVGVIAARGHGEATRRYLRDFVDRLGLADIEPAHDSGHLTRCRADDSPLRKGRVILAGDAAGLLEPWTREGISFALRSGLLAGAAAAADDLDGYERRIGERLAPEMRAGFRLLAAFRRRPGLFHTLLATEPGWRLFERLCQGRMSLDEVLRWRALRLAVDVLS